MTQHPMYRNTKTVHCGKISETVETLWQRPLLSCLGWRARRSPIAALCLRKEDLSQTHDFIAAGTNARVLQGTNVSQQCHSSAVKCQLT